MPPFSINVRHDVWKLRDTLDDLSKKQIPFASARALTEVAKLAKGDVDALIATKFDRPTPFTQHAAGFTVATKASQRATVFIKDIQAEYLALQETGGVRLPAKTALVVPAGIRLNQYGNMPKGALARLKGQRDIFIGRRGEVAGVFQRLPGDELKLLIRFTPQAKYKPILTYRQTVAAAVTRELPLALRRALLQALKTS